MSEETDGAKRVEVSCPPAAEQPVRVEDDEGSELQRMALELRQVRDRGKFLEYLRRRRKG